MTRSETGAWRGSWRGVPLRVDLRRTESDGGATLRVGPTDDGPEWLRFDCFRRNPHWHLDPSGRDEKHALDAGGDVVAEALAILIDQLVDLLGRAGVDRATLAAVGPRPGDEATLRDAEHAMRHRPAILDDLDRDQLTRRRSEKWHTHPPDVLPAWVAEMDFPVAAPIQAELLRFVESGDVGYPIALRETRLPEVFCARMAEVFDWRPEPDAVEILSEVVQGLVLAVSAFSRPGDGVVVQTPIYPPFLGTLRDTDRRLVENRMRPGATRLEFDLDGLAEAIDPETRMILFCNPHNPSGRVLARDELERVAELALAHDLVVVSDEIHADLLFDGRRHVPFASLSPEVARRTVTLTSASKAFNIPGLRCAIAHFGDPALRRRFDDVVPRHARGGIGLYGLYASMAAWRWGQPWLDEVVPYLSANRDYLGEALAERLPEIVYHPPEATFLAWLDCSGLGIEGSPARHFLRHGRVALSDGRLFGPGWEQYARLNFGTSRTILADVVDRVAKAVGR